MDTVISSNSEESDPFENLSDNDPEYICPQESKKTRVGRKRKLTDYFHPRVEETPTTCKQNCSRENPGSSSGLQSFSLQQTTQNSDSEKDIGKLANSPMLDGKFFKVVQFNNNHVEASCQLCLPKSKLIKGSAESTTNFVKHLKRIHLQKFTEYENYKKEKLNKKRDLDTVNPSTSMLHNKMHQTTLTTLRQKKFVSQEEFNKRVVHFVVNTISAVSIIDHPSFKALFDGFNLKVMGRKSLMNTIHAMFQSHQDDLKLKISNQRFLCSTADIWSSKRRSFIGVTLHWLDSNLQRVSVAIACQRFPGVHNYKAIAEMLHAIYIKYGIKNQQIIATVTDNGSNFVKAFKEFTLHDAEEVETDKEDIEEINMIDFPDTDESAETDLTIALPQHFRCASHTLNLIPTSDCMKAISANLSVRNKHMHAIDKCRKLWAKAGRPGTAEIIKNVLGHTLSSPGDTRWNSSYDSISRILDKDTKPKLPILHQSLGLTNFTDIELQYLEDYCQILKPLATALDILQGESNTYFGFLLPTLISLSNKWRKMKANFQGPRYFSANLILNACIDALHKRFASIFQLEWKEAIIAAASFPKFKICWYNALKTVSSVSHITLLDLDSLKQMVISEAESLMPISENTDSDDGKENPDKEYDGFYDFVNDDLALQDQIQGPSPSTQITKMKNKKRGRIELEFLQYVEDKRTNISMLDDYPNMKQLFIRYNTCLPSSASVERLFSFATMVNEPRRHALSDENFEKLVVLKANKIGL